jgi:hypothetical protein
MIPFKSADLTGLRRVIFSVIRRDLQSSFEQLRFRLPYNRDIGSIEEDVTAVAGNALRPSRSIPRAVRYT